MRTFRARIAAMLACLPGSLLAQPITFDAGTGMVNIPSVKVGSDTYTDVTLRLTDPASYGFALNGAQRQIPPGPAVAAYDGTSAILMLPSVQVGVATYVGVTLLNTGSYNFKLQTATEQAPATTCGSGGCSVTSASGAGIGVPAGALAQPVGIAITRMPVGAPPLPSGVTPSGSPFALTPHGTTFASSVTLTVPFEPSQVPIGATPVLYKTNAQWAWEPVANATVGNGTMTGQVTSFSFAVVAVTPPAPVLAGAQIAAGRDRAFARTNGGQIYAWGWDISEGLGDGPSSNPSTPASISVPTAINISDARAVATTSTSNHTLVLRPNGEVWGWGNNLVGQLGDGTKTNRASAVHMLDAAGVPISSAKAIAVGTGHSLVLLNNGTLLATGRNLHGQLGDGFATDVDRTRAALVPGLTNVIAIAAGGDLSMALLGDGTVWTWGDNRLGQLGIGSTDLQRDVPTKVQGLPTIVRIAAGGGFALALHLGGALSAWGYNFSGQLGDGSTVSRNVPGNVAISNVTAIAAGLQHVLALAGPNGEVWAWGANVLGEVGIGTQQMQATPLRVGALSGFVEVSAGNASSLAVDASRNVWSWGSNVHGEAGLGTLPPTNRQYLTPQQIPNLNLN